jgi:hypothetical protein
MKTVVSAYIVRWNLVLGLIFIAIISFMPEGLVPGSLRLWRLARQAKRTARERSRPAAARRRRPMTALAVKSLCKSFGGLRVTANVSFDVAPGERRLIIGPNGAGKTTLFNLITGEIRPDSGTINLLGRDITRAPSRRRAHLGVARTYQIITLFARDTILRNVTLALLGLSPLRWNAFVRLAGNRTSSRAPTRRLCEWASTISPSGRSRRPPMASVGGWRSRWRSRRTRRCCCSTSRSRASRSMSAATSRGCCRPSRGT